MKKYNILLGVFFILLSWLIPDHTPPWNTFYQEFSAALGFFVLFINVKKIFFPKKLVNLLSFFGILVLIQYFFGYINQGDLFLFLFLIILIAMGFSLGIHSFNDVEVLNAIYISIFGAALINCVIGLSQWQGISGGIFALQSFGRVVGNIAQPNQLATLIVMGFASLIYLSGIKKVSNFYIYTSCLIFIITLVATESRTAAVEITVLAIFVAFFKEKRDELNWLFVALLCYWILYLFWKDISDVFGGSSFRKGVGADSAGRIELWLQILNALVKQPLLGWGWLQLGGAQLSVIDNGSVIGNMDHAHNLILDVAVWFGIPAGLGFIAFFIYFIKNIYLKFNINGKSSSKNSILFFDVLMLIPISVHALLEYPLAYAYFYLPFVFFMGRCFYQFDCKLIKININEKLKVTYIFVTFSLFAMLGFEYLNIEKDFRAVRLEEEFNTSEINKNYYEGNVVILSQYSGLIDGMRINPETKISSEYLKLLKYNSERFFWLLTLKQYYLLLVGNGYCEEAKNLRVKIASLFKRFGEIKLDESLYKYDLYHACNK